MNNTPLKVNWVVGFSFFFFGDYVDFIIIIAVAVVRKSTHKTCVSANEFRLQPPSQPQPQPTATQKNVWMKFDSFFSIHAFFMRSLLKVDKQQFVFILFVCMCVCMYVYVCVRSSSSLSCWNVRSFVGVCVCLYFVHFKWKTLFLWRNFLGIFPYSCVS